MTGRGELEGFFLCSRRHPEWLAEMGWMLLIVTCSYTDLLMTRPWPDSHQRKTLSRRRFLSRKEHRQYASLLSPLSLYSLLSTLYSLLSSLFSLLSSLFSLLSPLFSLLSSLLVLAHRRPPVECRHRTSYHHPSRCLFPPLRPPPPPPKYKFSNSRIPRYAGHAN